MARPLSLTEAARFLGCAPSSLATRPWRLRHKIHAVKIGRTLRFDENTLRRALRAHREDARGRR